MSPLAPLLTVVPGGRRLLARLDVDAPRARGRPLRVFGILRATIGGTGDNENRAIKGGVTAQSLQLQHKVYAAADSNSYTPDIEHTTRVM